MSQQKKKGVLKWLNHITTGIFFTVLVAMILVVVIAKTSGEEGDVFGYQLKTVLSGSMEPDIQTGSLIAVETAEDKTTFNEGDVITFHKDEDMIVTHRIVDVMEEQNSVEYQTKGDNNDGPDLNPVPAQDVIAQYTGFTIPYVGYFINFTQSQNGALMLLIPGVLLLFYSGMTLWKVFSQLETKNNKA